MRIAPTKISQEGNPQKTEDRQQQKSLKRDDD